MMVATSWTRDGGTPPCCRRPGAVALLVGCGLWLAACGSSGGGSSDEVPAELRGIGRIALIHLDTVALALAVESGQPIQLPFALQSGDIVEHQLQLTLRNLRSADLTEFVLKDGDAGSGSSLPLPAPATNQGVVTDATAGVAVFTITNAAVEGSMLVSPDGWSFIEPLEPVMRLRGVDPLVRARLLKKYDHILYNPREAIGDVRLRDDMVFGLNCDLHDPAWRRDVGVMLGDMVRVTPDGAEYLSLIHI